MKISRIFQVIYALFFSTPTRNMINQIYDWSLREFTPPSPPFIKRRLLTRLGKPDAIWIETGTFEGETTEFLSRQAKCVYSIEPEPKLFANAKIKLAGHKNIELINGLSEEVFKSLLDRVNGDICFWLDGHFSGGITHQGPQDTPIVDELALIESHLPNWGDTRIFIDDIRCFDPMLYPGYPPLDHIVDWALRNNLSWSIEHDIFIARK